MPMGGGRMRRAVAVPSAAVIVMMVAVVAAVEAACRATAPPAAATGECARPRGSKLVRRLKRCRWRWGGIGGDGQCRLFGDLQHMWLLRLLRGHLGSEGGEPRIHTRLHRYAHLIQAARRLRLRRRHNGSSSNSRLIVLLRGRAKDVLAIHWSGRPPFVEYAVMPNQPLL